VADFVEICNVCARKAIIEDAKRIIDSDKVCHSYSDLNFGVTFLEHSVCKHIWIQTGNRSAKFHGNKLSLSKKYGKKSFRWALPFWTHTV